MVPKSKINLMAWATLIGFPLVSVTVVGFVEDDPYSFDWKLNPETWWQQVLAGTAYGLAAGFAAWMIIRSKFMDPVRNKYGGLIKMLNLNVKQVIFLSLAAGIGEEIFFRGVLQQYWGIWITSFVFVAIHGYLNPTDKRISVYGLFMTVIIAGVGYLHEYMGLFSAIFAHTMIDIILFTRLSDKKSLNSEQEEIPEENEEDEYPTGNI